MRRRHLLPLERRHRLRLRSRLIAAAKQSAETLASREAPAILSGVRERPGWLSPSLFPFDWPEGESWLLQALEEMRRELSALTPPEALRESSIEAREASVKAPASGEGSDGWDLGEEAASCEEAASALAARRVKEFFSKSLGELHVHASRLLAQSLAESAEEVCKSSLIELLAEQQVRRRQSGRFFKKLKRGLAKRGRAFRSVRVRRTQRQPWLGLKVLPSLSLISFLRLRGEGNLQGFVRYSAGPLNLVAG